MKFALVVLGAPCSSHAAFRFAVAVLATGHEIDRIFFYEDGVYCASSFNTPADGESNDTAAWQALGKTHQLDLAVCVSASMRRGLLTDSEAKKKNQAQGNIAEGFQIAGLGQLIDASLQADRLVTFGS